ncbi:exopolysaccharide biosynthesis polyprenyl glycosylphosphotransferase [Streptomyces sp. NPDC008150]|uniref:sugar transferase n=1 Tax=Streptomyces sp. NPDC008150 TaxID=3364816 RepID=UPI0036ED0A87
MAARSVTAGPPSRSQERRGRTLERGGDGLGKARWYRPFALLTDAAGAGVPLGLLLAAGERQLPWLGGLFGAAAWTGIRGLRRRYASRRLGESFGVLATARDWVLLAGAMALALLLTDVYGSTRPTTVFAATLPALLLTATATPVVRLHLNRQRRQARSVRRALVVGESAAVDQVVGRLASRTDHPYVVVGVVPVGLQSPQAGVPLLGRLAAGAEPGDRDADIVLGAVEDCGADVALVLPGLRMTGDRLRRVTWALHGAGLQLAVVPGLTEVAQARVRPTSAAGLTVLQIVAPAQQFGTPFFKSALDKVGSAFGLLLLAPLFAVIALAVRCSSPGPVFHRQTRCGLHGEAFLMWKFRTMVVDAEERLAELTRSGANQNDGLMFKMRRDPRVTRVGGVLRRLSLDELPQLFNVLRGDMSLIGPRPPLPAEVARYDRTALRRLAVRPGMTGLWQVSGRSDLSWDETVALDLFYVDNWSVAADMEILTRTLRAVVDGRGAY